MRVLILILAATFACGKLSYGQIVQMQQPPSTKFDRHMVEHGETLYALSKKYHTSVEELLRLNPEITENNLEVGTLIKVPIVSPELVLQDEARKTKLEHAIMYTVQKKETLYSIGKRYGTDVNTLMLWNDLPDASIQEGVSLIVGYQSEGFHIQGPLQTTQTVTKMDSAVNANKAVQSPESQIEPERVASSSTTGTDVVEKGIATWVKASGDDGNFYALHPTASPGTVLRVKNLMNGKTVDVKVIGKLPVISENENIMIKISSSAAKKLGVLDEKFLVEVSHPEITEEDTSSEGQK